MGIAKRTRCPNPRQRLPNRRENETVDLVFDGHRYHVTVGFAQDGRPREVFCHGGKVGSGMDLILDDACVALSLLLQHGIEPRDLAHSMGRLGDGAAASRKSRKTLLVFQSLSPIDFTPGTL